MKLKNKQGLVWLIPAIIVGGLLLGLVGGWITAWKINQTISSIPTWFWWVLIVLLILVILPKKNRK